MGKFEYVYKGEKYNSINKLATALGVSWATLNKYISEASNDIDKAVLALEQNTKSYTYEGKTYSSVVKLAKAAGVDRSRLNTLILKNNGKPVEDIINEMKANKEIKYIMYNGKEYPSIVAIANEVGLNTATVSKYLKLAGNDMDVAMNLYLEEHTYAVVDNVRYSSEAHLAKALGVSPTTLYKYIEINGSIDSAVEYIKKMKDVKFQWKGQGYTSEKALAEAMNIPYHILRKFLDKDGDINLDEIYETYYREKKDKATEYTYGEKKYSTIKEMIKDLGITNKRFYDEYKKCNGDYSKAIEKSLEIIKNNSERRESRILDREEARLAAEERKNNKPEYVFEGKIYKSAAEIARLSGISETQVRRLLNEYDNNLDVALENRKEKIIYNYNGQEYSSIKALADATGIRELKLGRYIRKYDRDAEKAIFMIRLRESRKKVSNEISSNISTQDMAIILGIRQRDLESMINSGMSIDDVKKVLAKDSSSKIETCGFKSSKLMYDEKQSLHDYCISNGLNYSCIFYSISTYGKTQEEAIENYKKNGQKIPTNWIFEKYSILLKHLLLSENIESKKVVAGMRVAGISFEEAIENYIIDEVSKERDLDKFWQREVYSCLTLENFSDEEKAEFIEKFMITPEEIEAIEDSKTRINQVKRKMLLFEMSECIKDNVFPHDEMATLMRLYDISDTEIDIIFLDLYSQFDGKVLLGTNQEEFKEKQQIIEYVKELPNYSEEEINDLKHKVSEENFNYIIETANLIKEYKQAVTTDVDLLKLMKGTVRENISSNADARIELAAETKEKSDLLK